MKYFIAPWSGWEEEFQSKEEALARAKFLIQSDESRLATLHGYKKPEHLIDERWDSFDEMYESLGEVL